MSDAGNPETSSEASPPSGPPGEEGTGDRPPIDLTPALGHSAGETLHAEEHADTAPVLEGDDEPR